MGTPTKYDPDWYPQRARRFALLGMTNAQIEAALEIRHETLVDWRNKYPEFDEAIRSGKDEADAAVAEALYKRATGFTYRALKVMQHQGDVIEHEHDEYVIPDVGAAAKWLHNRRPDLWRPVREPEDGEGDATPVKVVIEVKDGRLRAEPESAAS